MSLIVSESASEHEPLPCIRIKILVGFNSRTAASTPFKCVKAFLSQKAPLSPSVSYLLSNCSQLDKMSKAETAEQIYSRLGIPDKSVQSTFKQKVFEFLNEQLKTDDALSALDISNIGEYANKFLDSEAGAQCLTHSCRNESWRQPRSYLAVTKKISRNWSPCGLRIKSPKTAVKQIRRTRLTHLRTPTR